MNGEAKKSTGRWEGGFEVLRSQLCFGKPKTAGPSCYRIRGIALLYKCIHNY